VSVNEDHQNHVQHMAAMDLEQQQAEFIGCITHLIQHAVQAVVLVSHAHP
jgi:hypothetical protein